jgi:hypothetical protein
MAEPEARAHVRDYAGGNTADLERLFRRLWKVLADAPDRPDGFEKPGFSAAHAAARPGVDRPRAMAYIRPPFARVLREVHAAGWSSPVARQAHNLKVTSSNLVPATIVSPRS